MGRITTTVTGPGNPNVRWKIANPDIAAIDNNGVITSLNFGETLLIAQAANAADTAVVTVSQVAVNAEIDSSLDSLNFNALGDTVQYQAVATDSNGFEIQNTTPVLRWFSSDTNVVTIDSVTAEAIIRGNGRANVWVESYDNTLKHRFSLCKEVYHALLGQRPRSCWG